MQMLVNAESTKILDASSIGIQFSWECIGHVIWTALRTINRWYLQRVNLNYKELLQDSKKARDAEKMKKGYMLTIGKALTFYRGT